VQTIHLDIQDDKLNIEEIKKDTEDFYDVEAIKKEDNKEYTIDEARAKLGL